MYSLGNYIPGKILCGVSSDPLGLSGLGCADCGGTCGMSGLFESMDPRDWNWLEWLTAAGAVFTAYSLVSTTQRGVKRVRKAVRRRRR